MGDGDRNVKKRVRNSIVSMRIPSAVKSMMTVDTLQFPTLRNDGSSSHNVLN